MGINMGAVMFLMPRMVKILMEGLIPISESVRDFYKNVMVKEKFIWVWTLRLLRDIQPT